MKAGINILTLCTVVVASLFCHKSLAQVTLDANGPGQTYELINSKLSPGNTAVETPDQCASHPSFGRHIAEVWDATLNKFVFEFYIHVPTSFPVGASTADNDRCLSFDRQRVEIKTYEPSPANLKGTVGETVNYKWQFRLPTGFQPSPNFTHIHQIKAVGGDDGDPVFTLTVRAGSPNVLQLLHVLDSNTSQNQLAIANLSAFAGTWVEVTESMLVGANGNYSINIKRVIDGVSLLSYSTSNILTIRSSNSFIRPKWGIYRSLNNYAFLRDDSIRLAAISIQEGVLPVTLKKFNAFVKENKTNVEWEVENELNFKQYEVEYSSNGNDYKTMGVVKAEHKTNYYFSFDSNEKKYFVRVKLVDKDGKFSYSNVHQLSNATTTASIKIYPNPVKDCVIAKLNKDVELNSYIKLMSADGRLIKQIEVRNAETKISTVDFFKGMYVLLYIENGVVVSSNKIIIK